MLSFYGEYETELAEYMNIISFISLMLGGTKMFIIDQKPFNSPEFCMDVTECIKKYATLNNFRYNELLSARKKRDSKGYDWHVNEEVLIHYITVIDFLDSALASKYPEQMEILKKKLDFSVPNLLADIHYLTENISFKTILIADCKEIYQSKSNNQDCYVGSLIDYEEPNTTIGLFINKKYCKFDGFDDYTDLFEKKLLIQGEISYYKNKNNFQIKATSVKIIGQCTRLDNLMHWESECADILRTWDEVRSYPETIKKPDKIGLIANSRTQGYQDFMNTMHKNFGNYVPEIIVHDITMDVQNIVAVLQDLRNESDMDYVVIVRGGGDKESLTKLCQPDMLRAIAALGNVVTGIGHSDDNLLCGRAALYDAGTPTFAAQFIKAMTNKFYSQQKRDETAKKIEALKARTGFKSEKERAEYWEYAYKELEKAYNELLEEKKPKGIMGTLLGKLFG